MEGCCGGGGRWVLVSTPNKHEGSTWGGWRGARLRLGGAPERCPPRHDSSSQPGVRERSPGAAAGGKILQRRRRPVPSVNKEAKRETLPKVAGVTSRRKASEHKHAACAGRKRRAGAGGTSFALCVAQEASVSRSPPAKALPAWHDGLCSRRLHDGLLASVGAAHVGRRGSARKEQTRPQALSQLILE